MKRPCPRRLLYLLIQLSVLFTVTVGTANSQDGPVDFDGFQPSAVPSDGELDVALLGGGFDLIEEMDVFIEDVGIVDWQIESPNVIRIRIFVPPDAPPGSKRVEIGYVADATPFRAVIEDGFQVLEPASQPSAGPVQLFGVDPPEGVPGAEMDISLIGEGFAPAEDFDVFVEGVDILGREIESNEVIRARVFIPEDARPGPRRVEVAVMRDARPFDAVLEEAFLVRAVQPPPPPISSWLWPLITVLFGGVSFAVGRFLNIRAGLNWKQRARLQWQVQFQTKLPPATKACEWACKAVAKAKAGDRWRVTRIELTPLPVKGKTPPKKYVEGEALNPLNDLIKEKNASQEVMRRNLADVADKVLAQIRAWELEGQSPASIRVDADLAGTVNAEFRLYHCHQTNTGLAWGQPRLKWPHKLNQPGGEFLGVLRGPTAGEPDFAARARSELEECLQYLVKAARLRL